MAGNLAKLVTPLEPENPDMLKPIALPDSGPMPALPMVKMPQVVQPTPLQKDIQATSDRLQKVQWNQAHPWGDPENHPGKLGKIAHGFSVLGNIAGDIFAPNVMARIPGTEMHMNEVEGNLASRLGDESKEEAHENEQGAQADEAEARTDALRAPKEPTEQRPYTIATDEGELQWNPDTKQWTPITVNGEPAMQPERPGAAKPFQHVAGTSAGKQIYANYNPATGQFTDQQGNVLTDFRPADRAMQGALGQYAPVRLLTSLLQTAYNENPALLQVIKPLAEKIMSQYGVSGAGDVVGEVPAGQPQNDQGQPIGHRMPEAPTGATRSRGQFAQSVLPDIDSAEQSIASMRDQLGPMQGRWNDLYTAKIGAFGPEFSGLQTQLKNIGTAWMRLHANSETARQEFESALRGAQNPDNLIANLKAIAEQAQSYVKEGKGRPDELGTGGHHGPEVGTVEGGYRFKGGDPAKQENWEKVAK